MSKRPTLSWDYYVEMLVVADVKMHQYHGHELDEYVLTLFSTVSYKPVKATGWTRLYNGLLIKFNLSRSPQSTVTALSTRPSTSWSSSSW